MERWKWTIAVVIALQGVAAEVRAQPDTGAAADAGGVGRELAELERSRKELEGLTRQLEEQRAELERQTEQAKSQQSSKLVAGAVVVLVLVVGGIAWFSRQRKKSDSD